jgi:hypothetical protein
VLTIGLIGVLRAGPFVLDGLAYDPKSGS